MISSSMGVCGLSVLSIGTSGKNVPHWPFDMTVIAPLPGPQTEV
jgi:hypothetical protein